MSKFRKKPVVIEAVTQVSVCDIDDTRRSGPRIGQSPPMTHDEARALIADGRKHDEAMTPVPWYGRSRFVSRVPDSSGVGGTLHTNHVANVADRENAAGIAWMRTNLARLLDGYSEALEECERAQAAAVKSLDDPGRRHDPATVIEWLTRNLDIANARIDELTKGRP